MNAETNAMNEIVQQGSNIQFWMLIIAMLTAFVPIAVAVVAAYLNRRQALYELRSQQLIRVYEELIQQVTRYGVAVAHGQGVFEYYLSVLAKICAARIHSTAEIAESLDALEKLCEQVWQIFQQNVAAEQQGGTSRQTNLLETSSKMMLITTEIIAPQVNDQLGPNYVSSRLTWQNFKISMLYYTFKAKERLFREKMAKTETETDQDGSQP